MPSIETKLYPAEKLVEFSRRVFMHCDVPRDDAELAADVLSTADLRGIDSHGIARLSAYFEMLRAGRINPRPTMEVVRQTPTTATVDGDNGLGLVVGPRANQIAMDKAVQTGTGWVAARNSNHYGIAGYYPLQALARDLIGCSMTNSTALVAPLWGADRLLGTNPLAIAFPGLEEPPIVIDFASSAVAFGKIEIARRHQRQIPEGWAIDDQGRATCDPDRLLDGGALLTLGSDRERGGHKGYALSMMIDVLSCVLSGANWGPFAPPFTMEYKTPERQVGRGLGHFFGAYRIDAFIEADEFKRQIDDYIRTFRACRPAPETSGPLIPGDPERQAEADRRRDGVPLVMPVVEDLRKVSKASGIPFD